MNISKIAELSGVSKSTVSRVLSGTGSFSAKSQAKVMEVVNALDYRPNPYARILNKKSTNLIGVIVPDITNPYFPEIIQEIEKVCASHDYKIILCIIDSPKHSEIEYLDMLETMRVDGTILLCPTTNLTDLSAYDRQALVSVDAVVSHSIPFICSDFYKGGFLAGTKLIENNCKHLLHVSGHDYYYANIQRRNGFQAALSSHAGEVQSQHSLADISISHNLKDVTHYLNAHPEIDGIFTDNDSIAFFLLRALQELHIPVPDRIKIIGYDNNFMIPMVYPPLSTIAQPIARVGQLAAETIINMLHTQQVSYENILDVTYIKRETTLI